MLEKPEKIDWKKRLEAMKRGDTNKPPQSVDLPPEAPAQELSPVESVSLKPPEPLPPPQPSQPPEPFQLEPETEAEPEPEPKRQPKPQAVPKAVPKATPAGLEVKPVELPPPPPVLGPEPQAERLGRLEQQVRSLRTVAVAAALLAMLAVLGVAFMLQRDPGRDPRLSGTTLTLNDTKGVGRVWLGERDGQVRVELRDLAGRQRLGLGLDAAGEPRLTFYNKDQKVLGEIVPLPDGQPGITLLNQTGAAVAALPAPVPPLAIAPSPQAPPVPQPAMVPPEAPQAGQQSPVPAEDPSKVEETARFVANPGSKYYHLPTSPWVKGTPPNRLRKFSSTAEAEKAGLHPGQDIPPDMKH